MPSVLIPCYRLTLFRARMFIEMFVQMFIEKVFHRKVCSLKKFVQMFIEMFAEMFIEMFVEMVIKKVCWNGHRKSLFKCSSKKFVARTMRSLCKIHEVYHIDNHNFFWLLYSLFHEFFILNLLPLNTNNISKSFWKPFKIHQKLVIQSVFLAFQITYIVIT